MPYKVEFPVAFDWTKESRSMAIPVSYIPLSNFLPQIKKWEVRLGQTAHSGLKAPFIQSWKTNLKSQM